MGVCGVSGVVACGVCGGVEVGVGKRPIIYVSISIVVVAAVDRGVLEVQHTGVKQIHGYLRTN